MANMYAYDGPVLVFGKCVLSRWKSITRAPSKGRAKSNFAYQYKSKNNLLPGAKIELPGEIMEVM